MSVITWAGVDLTAPIGISEASVLAAAGAVYFLVNALAIAGVIALSTPSPTWTAIAGTRRDNIGAALTVCFAVVAALAVSHAWIAPLLLVPLLATLDWGLLQIETARGDARTDHKTQLLNSRGWQEAATRELTRRTTKGLAVAVIDLDHFKQVNDTWGHPAGDAVLKAVAAVLRATTRHNDVIGRFGGEEFVLLLPDTDAPSALAVAERIRHGISPMTVPTTDKRGHQVTIHGQTTSIGIATTQTPDLPTLIQSADAALYEAKTSGRDRIHIAG
jgi:diguanylate cyclase (GGDEF)-like protein